MSGTVGDNVARASGVIASAGGGGKILQMVQMLKTDVGTYNSASYGAITGFELAITPTKESSKIQLVINIGQLYATSTCGVKAARDIDGGGYSYLPAVGDGEGARSQAWLVQQAGTNGIVTGMYLDSPSYTLTDVITYQLHGKDGGGTMYFGRDNTDNDYDYRWRGAQIMQLWEISA